MKTIKLNDGHLMPVIGFGTWQTPDGKVAYESVKNALDAGYTHIDTAFVYGNEKSVGKAIKDSKVARSDIFLTTKLWNTHHSYELAKEAIATSLKNLDTDYLDLYLIHWPNPVNMRDSWEKGNAEAWRAMEEAKEAGLIRSIGISNFHPHHLDALLKTAVVRPAVNQVYASPSDPQTEIKDYNSKFNIVTQAYSPLGTGTILDNDVLKDIAQRNNKTVAQVAIRWSIQKGYVPLPKSVTKSRIYENIDVFDFELSDNDMALIDTLRGIGKEGLDPDNLDF